ncbi:hypothetical protein PUN28_004470 [Cardiocondyla obscurior]|uniref:Uncharacterized protein n=1 Tax=Cardiocondyla obscurior TaxID=286306 RepID=A0AAW2GDP3_9HYME
MRFNEYVLLTLSFGENLGRPKVEVGTLWVKRRCEEYRMSRRFEEEKNRGERGYDLGGLFDLDRQIFERNGERRERERCRTSAPHFPVST